MATPDGEALIRVLQASLKQNLVTVSYGTDVLARQLTFGSATSDAAGSQAIPKGGADTGFGGTAAHPAPDPAPWLLLIAAGVLLAATGLSGLRRIVPA